MTKDEVLTALEKTLDSYNDHVRQAWATINLAVEGGYMGAEPDYSPIDLSEFSSRLFENLREQTERK